MTAAKKVTAKKNEIKKAFATPKKAAKPVQTVKPVVKKEKPIVKPVPAPELKKKPLKKAVKKDNSKKFVPQNKIVEKKVLAAVEVLSIPDEVTPKVGVTETQSIVEGVDYDKLTPSHELQHYLNVIKDHVLAKIHYSGDANNSERSGTEPDDIVRFIKSNETYMDATVNMYDKHEEVMFEMIQGNLIAQVTIRKSVDGCSGVIF